LLSYAKLFIYSPFLILVEVSKSMSEEEAEATRSKNEEIRK